MSVLAQNFLNLGHINLGFKPGTSDLFDRFLRYFLVKKNVEPKQCHKMKKLKRHFVANEISNCCMLI
jgi:hypothetical protein